MSPIGISIFLLFLREITLALPVRTQELRIEAATLTWNSNSVVMQNTHKKVHDLYHERLHPMQNSKCIFAAFKCVVASDI